MGKDKLVLDLTFLDGGINNFEETVVSFDEAFVDVTLSAVFDVLFLLERLSQRVNVLFNLEEVGVVPGKVVKDLRIFVGWIDRIIDELRAVLV